MTEEKRICSKCGKAIKDDHKHCPSCGGKVVDQEEHRVHGVKKRKIWLYFVIPIVVILIIGSVVIFVIPFQYKATEAYDVQEPYTDTEYFYENEPYATLEYYNEEEPYTVCAGYSFWTGKCNQWKTEYRTVTKSRTVSEYQQVQKSRTVTKYKTIQKEKEVWKKDTLFNMWTGKTQYWYKV